MKMWTETRWESVEPLRYQAAAVREALRYQAAAVREALIEVRDQTKDPVIKIEAQSFSEEVGSYHFSICTVVWYDILSQIQHVSKLMQSPRLHVDVAVSLLRKTERGLSNYRATGFMTTQMSANDICEGMNVEAVLQQKKAEVHKAALFRHII